MASFTPGPWRVVLGSDEHGYRLAGVVAAGSMVAIVNVSSDAAAAEQIANAHLLAAAPDLYEALKGAVETIQIWHSLGHPVDPGWAIYLAHAPEMQRITAALAKAEGR